MARRRVTLSDLEARPDGTLLSMPQVCEVLGLSVETVKEMLDAEDIRGVRVGRAYKVIWHSLRDYLYKIGALPLRENERKRMEHDLKRRQEIEGSK